MNYRNKSILWSLGSKGCDFRGFRSLSLMKIHNITESLNLIDSAHTGAELLPYVASHCEPLLSYQK